MKLQILLALTLASLTRGQSLPDYQTKGLAALFELANLTLMVPITPTEGSKQPDMVAQQLAVLTKV